TDQRFDVYVSYSGADQDWVRHWLVPHLEAEGVTVCIDYKVFTIGVPRLINIENAIAASRYIVLVLSPAWIQGEWPAFESIVSQQNVPADILRRTLPVLHQPSDLPPRISMLTKADLTGQVDEEM